MRNFTASVSFMFRELPLLDRFAAARDAGFAGVEIQVIDEGAPEAMAAAARGAEMPVVLINAPMGDYLAGGPGLSAVPGREGEFRAAVARALDAADLLDARIVHLGPSRVPDGARRADCLAIYETNAAMALSLAEGRGLSLVLEPVNAVDAPTALFTDIDAAASFLRDRFGGRIGLLFDLYHLTMGGADIASAARAHRDLIRHVQFSDVPGRREPGTGRIDFAAAFAALEDAGYDGWFGAEYFPDRPTAETLAWMAGLRRPI
jgi:hydroxypyruvate isomerase